MAEPVAPDSASAQDEESNVESMTYLRLRSVRLDYAPLLTALGAIYFLIASDSESWFELAMACVGGAAFLEIFTMLLCLWSVDVRAALRYQRVARGDEATMVKVRPHRDQGSTQLCPVERTGAVSIVFQKRRYFYRPAEDTFTPADFPANLRFGQYLSHQGVSHEQATVALEKYGANAFDVPSPTFGELYMEQATAPFFVFQIFCVDLWCLDEFWQYAVFTLFMLFVFEATVVKSRMRNLGEIRRMVAKPYPIFVYRSAKWQRIDSDQLVPGDLVSLERSEDVHAVPADLILVQGSAVVNEAMLTGESVPQMKEPISIRDAADTFNFRQDKLHIIFSGTKVVQQSAGAGEWRTPNGGCVAYVLRTGFHTTQGKLVRTILFATERMTANNLESLVFILFLLSFAIAASWYVWTNGVEDEKHTRWKRILECVLIVTSVVPPELPIELSLAVNTSLMALTKLDIFCTEPFRIPLAGRVDVACFDKTGTLTTEDLVLQGVAGLGEGMTEATVVPANVTAVMAGCQTLMNVDGEIIGDPMEKATLQAINWTFSRGGAAESKKGRNSIRSLHRFHFTSELKRMSVVAQADDPDRRTLVLAKGAPEVMADKFATLPVNYYSTHKHYSLEGARVIALGYKELKGNVTQNEAQNMNRADAESGLSFAGFLIFHCPLKADTKDAIAQIKEASHRIVMITGDAAPTACYVAAELQITTKPTLVLSVRPDGSAVWMSGDESVSVPYEQQTTRRTASALAATYDLCLTGTGLTYLTGKDTWNHYCPHVKVYARVAPEQKEFVLTSLKNLGYGTLMCGDGTNDVGALKQAHVGVALLNSPIREVPTPVVGVPVAGAPAAAALSDASTSSTDQAEALKKLQQRKGKKDARALAPVAAPGPAAKLTPQAQLQKMLKEAEAADEVPTVKLGDASVASPFTSKKSSVMSIVQIIRQGRCTLVTTLQMYKILALNCLINAFSMSVLYLDGVKFGDTQMTAVGMMVAVSFLCISRSQPLPRLSRERPERNIFSLYWFTSVLGQFALHLWALTSCVALAKANAVDFDPSKPIDFEAKFTPNVLNSVVFLVSLIMQVSTFTINYRGHPFMNSLWENKPMLGVLAASIFYGFVCASNLVPPLNDYFELVMFPTTEMRDQVLYIMSVDFFGAWAIEIFAKLVLYRSGPRIPTN